MHQAIKGRNKNTRQTFICVKGEVHGWKKKVKEINLYLYSYFCVQERVQNFCFHKCEKLLFSRGGNRGIKCVEIRRRKKMEEIIYFHAFPPRGEKEECEGVYISICEQF